MESGVFSRAEYAKKDFWNKRFENHKGYFDWYLEYKELRLYFAFVFPIPKNSKVLIVGCGNSKLTEQMYTAGYKDITSIDISDVIIKKMREDLLNKGIDTPCIFFNKIKVIEMDATNMTFENESFDAVIDKGTFDALISGGNYEIPVKLVNEMGRVVKKGGSIILISHAKPEARAFIFDCALGVKDFRYCFCRTNLSPMSQLINIMRSNLKDKPINSILKDKEALQKSFNEFANYQGESSKIDKRPHWIKVEGVEMEPPNIKFVEYPLKIEKKSKENIENILKQEKELDNDDEEEEEEIEEIEENLIVDNKKEKEDNEKIIEKIENNKNNTKDENNTKEIEKNKEIKETLEETEELNKNKKNKESTNNLEETKELNKNEEKEISEDVKINEKPEENNNINSEKDEKFIYNPKRQCYCYIYRLEKLF